MTSLIAWKCIICVVNLFFLFYFALFMNYFRVFCLHVLMTVLIIFRLRQPYMFPLPGLNARWHRTEKQTPKERNTRQPQQTDKTLDIPLTYTIIYIYIYIYIYISANFNLYSHERSVIFVRTEHSLRSWKLPTLTKKNKNEVDQELN